jgi:hypothetical protein
VTGPIAWDASSQDMMEALNALRGVHGVSVHRSPQCSGHGFVWTIVFENDMGPRCRLTVEADNTVSSDATAISVGSAVGGVLSAEYGFANLTAQELEYTVTGLTAGTVYFARVSAMNERCSSLPTASLPLSATPPKQKPDVVVDAQLAVQSATSIKVLWSAPESDGADAVTKYKIEWSTSEAFAAGAQGGSQEVAVASATDCRAAPCSAVISSPAQGVPLFVRTTRMATRSAAPAPCPTRSSPSRSQTRPSWSP